MIKADEYALSSKIDEIILDNIIAKTKQSGDSISFDYLIGTDWCTLPQIRAFRHRQNDLFTVGKDSIFIKADSQLLEQRAKKYIRNNIAKLVNPSQFKENSFQYIVGRMIDDTCYTQHEKEFVWQMVDAYFDIASIKQTYTLTLSFLMKFNNYNAIFNYAAKEVYNGVLQRTLSAGDDITEIFNRCCDGRDKPVLAYFSKVFEWFFCVDKDKSFSLRCDLDTNKNLFVKNFLNTVIFHTYDSKAKNILVQNLQCRYGSILSDVLTGYVLEHYLRI